MSSRVTKAAFVLCFLLSGCGGGDENFAERISGSAESVDGILYVMGGMTLSRNLPDVGAYEVSSKTWTRKASIPTPRAATASAVLQDDIYVLGGRNKAGVLSVVERYSTGENNWSPAAPMPTARWNLMACSVGDEIYAFGGVSGTGDRRRALDIVEAYDPKNDSWRSAGTMPEARQGGAVAVVEGLVYIISGKIGSYAEGTEGETQITERVDSFDPKTMAWARVRDIPGGRVGAKAIVRNGLVFVVGGLAKSGECPTRIDVFDPAANEWRAGPHLSSGRSGIMCGLVADSILVFGGASPTSTGGVSISGSMEAVSLAKF